VAGCSATGTFGGIISPHRPDAQQPCEFVGDLSNKEQLPFAELLPGVDRGRQIRSHDTRVNRFILNADETASWCPALKKLHVGLHLGQNLGRHSPMAEA